MALPVCRPRSGSSDCLLWTCVSREALVTQMLHTAFLQQPVAIHESLWLRSRFVFDSKHGDLSIITIPLVRPTNFPARASDLAPDFASDFIHIRVVLWGGRWGLE